MQIQEVAVEALIPYAKNSRTHSDAQVAQIAASIKEFGWTNPILIDGTKGIIAGHGRLMAARKLGYSKVPVIELKDMTESQKKAYVIADNQLAMNAGWDIDLLKIEVADLQEDGFDLELLGFDNKMLDSLLEPEVKDGLTDEDAVPELPKEPKTKLGDIYILGEHRLMCGDSTSIEAVEKLTDGLVDILVTDPPYNVNYEGATKDKLKIMNDSMDDEQFRQFLRDAFVAADAVMKQGAVYYIWHADSEGYNFRGACRDAGWKVRQTLIWAKDSMVMGRQDYHWKHEPCLYGWKEGAAHLWAADRKQTTIIECKKPRVNDIHPTMKPVELMEYQILNNTKGQDVVLDLFGGSGSTLIACEKTGRKARLMELDPKYCDVIVKRWEDFTGKQAVLSEL
jgi:DNA modification methylase